MRPRLFIVIDSEILGGPGRGLLLFLKNVRPHELEYTLVNFDRPRRRSSEFIEAAGGAGIPLELLWEQFRFDPRPVLQACALFKERAANLVQSHGYKSHLVALALSRRFQVPWVAFSHGWTAEDSKIRLYNTLERRLVKYADEAVAVSPTLYRTISLLRKGRSTSLIANAVDAAEISGRETGREIRARYGWTQSHLVLGCFGRLSPEKGQDLLVQAFRSLAHENPLARLLIVGDGVMRRKLMQQVRALGLCEQVIFAGHQSAMRGYYEAVNLLVLPSRCEGLPNVMLEAMALGVPVLAAAVGAVPEVIDNGKTGWLVSPGDSAALYTVLSRICADARGREAAAGAAASEVETHYSARARAELLLALYRKVLARGEASLECPRTADCRVQ